MMGLRLPQSGPLSAWPYERSQLKVHYQDLLVDYESEDFPASVGTTPYGQLRITWDDILWAAVTVGRPNRYYVFRHGTASRFEAIFRWSLVRMALEQRGDRLYRTDAFKSLDPTEKGAVSYFLGMAFCKVFAAQLLRTPWLLHLDVFRNHLNPDILPGRSRPDFVGQETGPGGRWHGFESKGRSSVLRMGEKNKAKAQAQRLISVDGTPVQLHIGALTYFKKDELRFYWRDPNPEEPEDLEPIMLEMPDEAWGDYYEPVSVFLRETGEPSNDSNGAPVAFIVEHANIAVGAHPEILPHLLKRKWQTAHDVSREMAAAFQEEGYQPDGLIIKCSESWEQPYDTL